VNLSEQIKFAIGAHGLWKSRLRDAVNSGKSDTTPIQVRDDHQCNFGKWLFSPEIPAAAKQSAHYRTCVDLHHRFHGSAADVLTLALAGKKEPAEKALDDHSEFARLSVELVAALMAWMKT
jgi:Chemoreceptor zinc-binding domain